MDMGRIKDDIVILAAMLAPVAALPCAAAG